MKKVADYIYEEEGKWYFRDEIGEYCGPFNTQIEAETNLSEYAKCLMEDAH
jgi:hypothetical protein